MVVEMRRPARVLLTTDTTGGVWTYVLELAKGLGAKGIESVLAILGPRAGADQVREAKSNPTLTLQATELPLDWLARSEREVEDCARVLWGIASRNDVDIVHLHAPALAGRRRWQVPLVVSAHSCVGTWWSTVHGSEEPPDITWRSRLTRDGMQTADAVIAPSQSFADALAMRYGLSARVAVVQNGRTPLLGRRTIRFSQRTGVITAGRLWDPAKDMATLDRAAPLMNTSVTAAGPTVGPDGRCFQPNNITMLGTLDAMRLTRRYAAAAVFVSSAVYEPFGLAALEAAQNSTALVLSDIPTHRELWGGVALFFPPRNSGKLAECVNRVIEDEDLRHKLAQLAENRAKRFTAGRMVGSTMNIYVSTMAKAQVRRRPAHAA